MNRAISGSLGICCGLPLLLVLSGGGDFPIRETGPLCGFPPLVGTTRYCDGLESCHELPLVPPRKSSRLRLLL